MYPNRRWYHLGILSILMLLTACASTVKQTMGYYHAPQLAYTLPLDSNAFRGQVTLTEGCDHVGGSLNIWDAQNRFFRIDYLRINQDPLAMIPPYAADRTIAEEVLANYERKVIPASSEIKVVNNLGKVSVRVRNHEGMFAMVSLTMQPKAVPELKDKDQLFYYGFLIFKDGDLAYVLQHRMPSFQPDRMRVQLQLLASDMIIPGHPPTSPLKTFKRVGHAVVHGVEDFGHYAIGTPPPPVAATCEWNAHLAQPTGPLP